MCGGNSCPVHSRTDMCNKVDETEFFSAISYVGEWAVFSDDNLYYEDLVQLDKHGLYYMTIVVRIGDGCLGDVLGRMQKSIYFMEVFEEFDQVINAHDMIVSSLRSKLLKPEAPINVEDFLLEL